MKLNLNEIRVTPENMPFAFCVYGDPSDRVLDWTSQHDLIRSESGPFTNFEVPGNLDLSEVLDSPRRFSHMDGFSPNLEKALHVGHLSNLIFASALYNLGVAESTVAIFGDTIGGDLSASESLNNYDSLIETFNYPSPDKTLFASKTSYLGGGYFAGRAWPEMIQGTGSYEGTKGFLVDGEYVVGVKSDGSTTYFYQDMGLRQHLLGEPTLYLTGSEQNPHFAQLAKLDSNVEHVGLGLVSVDGKKMATREGNVIYVDEILETVAGKFDGRVEVASNVLTGQILRTNTSSNKSIDTATLADPKTSPGLYLTYTFARMSSCGLDYDLDSVSTRTQYAALKAAVSLQPVVLFERLMTICKDINALYGKYLIKDDPSNAARFQPLVNDLAFGMKALGMNLVETV